MNGDFRVTMRRERVGHFVVPKLCDFFATAQSAPIPVVPGGWVDVPVIRGLVGTHPALAEVPCISRTGWHLIRCDCAGRGTGTRLA